MKECCVLTLCLQITQPDFQHSSGPPAQGRHQLRWAGPSPPPTSIMNQENAHRYFPQANPHRGSRVMSRRVSEVVGLRDSSYLDQMMKSESRSMFQPKRCQLPRKHLWAVPDSGMEARMLQFSPVLRRFQNVPLVHCLAWAASCLLWAFSALWTCHLSRPPPLSIYTQVALSTVTCQVVSCLCVECSKTSEYG